METPRDDQDGDQARPSARDLKARLTSEAPCVPVYWPSTSADGLSALLTGVSNHRSFPPGQ
jgi:hypothetical protein